MNDTLKDISVAFGNALIPLKEASSSIEAFQQLLLEMGWTSEEIPEPIQKLLSFSVAIEEQITIIELGGDVDINGLQKNIKNLIEVIDQLKTASFNPILAAQGFATKFPPQLLQFLVAKYLYSFQPKIGFLLKALGILKTKYTAPSDGHPAYIHTYFEFKDLPQLLKDPVKIFENAYGWRTDDFDYKTILGYIQQLVTAQGIPAYFETIEDDLAKALDGIDEPDKPMKWALNIPFFAQGTDIEEIAFGLLIYGLPKNTTSKPGLALIPYFNGEIKNDLQINDFLKFTFDGSLDAKGGIALTLRPDEGFNFFTGLLNPDTASNVKGTFKFGITNANKNNQPIIVIGSASGSRIEYGSLSINAGAVLELGRDPSVFIEFDVEEAKIVINLGGDGDGFLQKIVGKGFEANIDLTIGWSNLAGIYFKGSGGLEIMIPSHISIGPVDIQSLSIALKPEAEKIPIDIAGTIKIGLGPLTVVIEGLGLSTIFKFPSGGGNLGPLNLDIGFKPPNGLGLSINAGAVIGGGYLFFDFEKEEYAGALELTIAGFISAKAIGLITTKMPDGSKGFSMLIIITAEFNPPFQLSYGFTLIGVGGLLGLNRTVLLDPLRNAVRTGAVNSIMFPQNVIANAPRIISDLKAIFPPYEGKFLIGPMGKLGWGTPTLISLSLGLIIEIPGNIAILGVLKIALPEERIPLIQIQVLFVGTIDFDRKMLTFDASLYESFILAMTLEGDMAVRLKWGDEPDFILTVGGFYPSYTPPPLALPTLRRLAINILNTEIAKIRIECYQAVTSNTVQFGSKAELYFGFSAISIRGHIQFDALFQFSPFYFIIEISGSVSLDIFGMGVFSIRLRLTLEGPTPWRAKGRGSISFFFFDVSADFDKTWGDSKNTSLPDIIILPRFIEELKKREQWSAVLSEGKNLLVSLLKFEETATPTLVLHPAGSLVVQQKLLPLLVKIDKIGNQKTSDVQKIIISKASSAGVDLTTGNVDENFARAQYQNLSDAEKLSKPSFEKMPGGVKISMGAASIKNGKMARKKIEYEITIVDKEPKKPLKKGLFFDQIGLLFTHFLKGNSVSKSVLSKSYSEKLKPYDEKLNILEEGYAVAFQADNKAFNNTATFASEMMAQTFMQEQLVKNPSLKKEIHIIPNYELQEL